MLPKLSELLISPKIENTSSFLFISYDLIPRETRAPSPLREGNTPFGHGNPLVFFHPGLTNGGLWARDDYLSKRRSAALKRGRVRSKQNFQNLLQYLMGNFQITIFMVFYLIAQVFWNYWRILLQSKPGRAPNPAKRRKTIKYHKANRRFVV